MGVIAGPEPVMTNSIVTVRVLARRNRRLVSTRLNDAHSHDGVCAEPAKR